MFFFQVGQGYPHDPPKVKCETMVYHPNIDLEGNVCLNILRYHVHSYSYSSVHHHTAARARSHLIVSDLSEKTGSQC